MCNQTRDKLLHNFGKYGNTREALYQLTIIDQDDHERNQYLHRQLNSYQGARRRRSGGGPGGGCARRPVGTHPPPPGGGRWQPYGRAMPRTVGG
jgi:hypothetical protein